MKKKTESTKPIDWKGKVEKSLSDIELIDSENQNLQFRVGQVFFEKGCSQIGLWITYQEKYMQGDEKGPVLMSQKNWETIRNFIDRKFKEKR